METNRKSVQNIWLHIKKDFDISVFDWLVGQLFWV